MNGIANLAAVFAPVGTTCRTYGRAVLVLILRDPKLSLN
jgi:hypothetical protein